MGNKAGNIRATLKERFWAKVRKRKSGCWEWVGAIHRKGYGVIYVLNGEHKSKAHRAHRVAWFLHYGVWPTKWILHTCDNRKCERPKHLYEGTGKDNSDDRENRGRGKQPRGIRNGHAKLNAAKVRIIRLTNLPDEVWAERFGVAKTTVMQARIGVKWKWLTDTPPVRRRPERKVQGGGT